MSSFRRSIRCRLGFHAWDYLFERSEVRGFGSSAKVIGYYCIRCGVESPL